MNVAALDESRLARTGEEYVKLAQSDASWIVRSPDDLRQLRSANFDPLSKLPQKDFDDFVSGLDFKGGGVAHGTYKPLMATCTITEIFQVFERFGMHRDYTVRILEASCVLPPPDTGGGGDCEFSFWSFCSSLCGIVVYPPFSAAKS